MNIPSRVEKAYQYIRDLEPAGINYELSAITAALKELGDPQLAFPSIIVAGTNGKGSTSAMIAAILAETGSRIGFYNSPHLVDYRERYLISGRRITKPAFASVVENISRRLKKADLKLTSFEFSTALAFEYFRNSVDVAVLEIGMGGRLDAVNLAAPMTTVITPISFDHSGFLGNSLAEIAAEKAAIIRPGAPCICARQLPEAATVIERRARRLSAPLYMEGRDFEVIETSEGFDYRSQGLNLAGLKTSLPGAWQASNAGLALRTIEELRRLGLPTDEKNIRAGLRKVRWPARLQKIGVRPPTWLDGAHNLSGAEALAGHFSAKKKGGQNILVFGCSDDKQTEPMLASLAAAFDRIFITDSGHAKSMKPAAIKKIATKYFRRIESIPSPAEALRAARAQAGPTGRVLVTGSLYLAGEILRTRT